MATYQIHINEQTAFGKNLVAMLRTASDVSFEMPGTRPKKEESKLYKRLDSAFADVRAMMDGKKKEKTVEEFLDEIRNNND